MPIRDPYAGLRQQIQVAIREHPGMTLKEIAEHLEENPRVIETQLKRLKRSRSIRIEVGWNHRGQAVEHRYFAKS